jgi:hypothetical protein
MFETDRQHVVSLKLSLNYSSVCLSIQLLFTVFFLPEQAVGFERSVLGMSRVREY